MLNLAVKKMISHQSLSVKDAMKLADFSAIDINNKNMQRKVLRRLPGKGKRAFNSNDTASSYTTATTHVASVIDAGSSNQTSDMSPLSDPSSSSSARKKTKHCLNSKQKQEQRVADLAQWNAYKLAHKEDTALYAEERAKEGGGMSYRKVEKIIKTK